MTLGHTRTDHVGTANSGGGRGSIATAGNPISLSCVLSRVYNAGNDKWERQMTPRDTARKGKEKDQKENEEKEQVFSGLKVCAPNLECDVPAWSRIRTTSSPQKVLPIFFFHRNVTAE